MKKIIALMMTALMICALFAGCGNDKETASEKTAGAVTIPGETLTLDAYVGALRYVDGAMQQNTGTSFASVLDTTLGEGVTGETLLKESAFSMLKEFEAVKLLAKENGVTSTAEDIVALEENKTQMIASMGGEEAYKAQLEARGMTEGFFDYMTYAQYAYQKVHAALFTGDAYGITAEKIVATANAGGYICVKHVLVKTAEDGSDVEAKKALAEEIAAKATAGEDFDALIAQYGEDPGMQSAPYGYIIDQNGYTTTGSSMVQEFTAGSIALEVGGVSAPVQTSYGFHVIKRFPIDVEYVNANFDGFSSEFSMIDESALLGSYLQKTEVVLPKGSEYLDLYKVFGIERPEPETTTEGTTEGEVSGIEQGVAVPSESEEPAIEVVPAQ